MDGRQEAMNAAVAKKDDGDLIRSEEEQTSSSLSDEF